MGTESLARADNSARIVRGIATIAAASAAGWSTAWLLGRAAQAVSGNRQAPWIVGRASGITAYVLLVAVVAMGLVLAHPWRTRIRRPSTVSRIRAHAILASFTLAFTVLHVVVLATDHYAGVGWRGALLPLGASYRPVPVTLGVIGLYAGLLSGVTASLAGRIAARVWWPLHKVSAGALILVWAHGLLAGSDSSALRMLYLATGAGLMIMAVSRYTATTPADRFDSLGSASMIRSRPTVASVPASPSTPASVQAPAPASLRRVR